MVVFLSFWKVFRTPHGRVTLINGAQASNIFWQVTRSATLMAPERISPIRRERGDTAKAGRRLSIIAILRMPWGTMVVGMDPLAEWGGSRNGRSATQKL
jgi:hypothetical protein